MQFLYLYLYLYTLSSNIPPFLALRDRSRDVCHYWFTSLQYHIYTSDISPSVFV